MDMPSYRKHFSSGMSRVKVKEPCPMILPMTALVQKQPHIERPNILYQSLRLVVIKARDKIVHHVN